MWHVRGVCCLCATCSKSPAGEECQSSLVPLQSLQSPQLRIGRQLGWHPMGTSSDFFFENNWNAASLTAVPEQVQGAAPFIVHVTSKRRCSSGQISSWVGMPAFPGPWCKPCFQWGQYLPPQYSQMVHLDITSQYLLKKHKCWPFSIDGTVAQAYSSVEGMVSRWMVDANGFDWRFHLIWRWWFRIMTTWYRIIIYL